MSIPARWTDVEMPDPYVVVAAGRSHFRVVDLVELASMVAAVGSANSAQAKKTVCRNEQSVK